MSVRFQSFFKSRLGAFKKSPLGVRGKENEVTYAHAASTVTLTLSGEQTVDGIALVSGNFCLAKNQSSLTDRDLYKVKTGAWVRVGTATAPTPSVHVLNGTTNGRLIFSINGTTYSANKAVYG